MIKSMTGYGNAKLSADDITVSVELRSVNNRYLETSVRIPRTFLALEDEIKNTVKQHISRGKVDLFVSIDSSAADTIAVTVNGKLAEAYVNALRQMSEAYTLPFDLTASSLSRLPDVLSVEKEETENERIAQVLHEALKEALADFDAMRTREGAKLQADVASRIETIEGIVSTIEQAAPETVALYRTRLEQKLQEVLQSKDIDESRILTEAAVFADRIAVDEELVRLRSHIAQMKGFLEEGSPIGKKMDFLIQEFNREANTIGSKCQNSAIAHVVVDLKAEIEKIREQIQNIE
jgi:uncharacterized protein (TIGR00255 family)